MAVGTNKLTGTVPCVQPSAMRKKSLPPRRKRMTRRGRLDAARHWLPKYTGKNVVRGYAKWFDIDLGCALKELQVLGVALDGVCGAAAYDVAERFDAGGSPDSRNRISQRATARSGMTTSNTSPGLRRAVHHSGCPGARVSKKANVDEFRC